MRRKRWRFFVAVQHFLKSKLIVELRKKTFSLSPFPLPPLFNLVIYRFGDNFIAGVFSSANAKW
jgi:hypothetical protein